MDDQMNTSTTLYRSSAVNAVTDSDVEFVMYVHREVDFTQNMTAHWKRPLFERAAHVLLCSSHVLICTHINSDRKHENYDILTEQLHHDHDHKLLTIQVTMDVSHHHPYKWPVDRK